MRAAAAVRRGSSDRGRRIRGALAQRPRCRAVLANGAGDWPLWRVSITPARGARVRGKAAAGRAVLLRLGRRADLAGAAAVGRRRRRDDPPRRGHRPAVMPRWCARPPLRAARSMCSSRSRARSRASAGASRRASIRRASSIPAACGRASDADQFHAGAARRSGHREADKILRTCVHCGFCTATCPTYVLLGDELDWPRGRIYLIKEMLEHERAGDRRGRHPYRPLPVVPVPA